MEIAFDNSVVAGALTPLVASFDEAALESLVRFQADGKTQRLFDELAEKASNGELTAKEQRVYDTMVGTSAIVAVMQAQAEKRLTESRSRRG